MIYDWSRKQAEQNPGQTAVSLGEEHISYEQLEIKSNQLAGKLIENGLKPGDRVGLYLEKTPKTVIAMLGISKAGGVYVPLDYSSPAERVIKIIHSSDLSLLFISDDTTYAFQDALQVDHEIGSIPWVWWSDECIKFGDDHPPLFCYKELKDQPDKAHGVVRDEYSPAHILFTSGSTGQPKGVVITHNNIRAFVEWAVSFFGMETGEKTSCHSPLHFDLSTFDIYGAFAAGCHLHLVPSEISVHPKKLSDFILENELDQWFSVPSALSYLARFKAIPEGGYPHLKRLIWCGEVFALPALQYWMKSLPNTQFTNLYGPTEATIASSYHTVENIPEQLSDVPIGRPCKGEELLILDEELKNVPTGEIGDLFIAGEGLSPGYWRDTEKTEAAFIWHKDEKEEQQRIYRTGDLASADESGLIHFHGRSDYQIKSRGYRIELGEIEAALAPNEELREFAVVPVQKNGFEGTSIGCAYVSSGNQNGELPPLLKKKLSQKLSGYMIPQYWRAYEILPRNGNGKIDRKALSENFES